LTVSESVRTILDQALQLSEADRGAVAARLLESLDPAGESDVERAWADEVRERLDEVRSGRVTPVPWDEARRQIAEDDDAAG
jgi:putative addiction module component (TIGR02574 family)